MKRAWALLAACAILYVIGRDAYYVGFFNDDAFYIIGARSLLEGRYAELNAPGQPPLVNYLPGFSLLLSPVAAVAGDALWPFQLAAVALMLGGLWFFSRLAPVLAPRAAWAALALAAVTPLTVSLAATVLSDVPLLTAAMAALYWASRNWKKRKPGEWTGVLLLLGFSCLLRPTGAALPMAFAVALAWERRWKLAGLCCAAGAAFVLPFLARNRALTGQSLMYFVELAQPYAAGSPWAALSANLLLNSAYYSKFIFETMLFRWPVESPMLTAATVGAGVAAVAAGIWRAGGQGWIKVPAIFLALFLGAHLAWSKQAGRYMLPVFPLIVGYGLNAARGRWAWPAAGLALLLLAAPNARVVTASLRQDSPMARPARRAYAWIGEQTRQEDIFAAELDGRLHLLTRRPVVHLRRLFEPEALSRWLSSQRVAYVFLTPADFIMTTSQDNAPNDPMPTAQLLTMLSDRTRYELVFADAAEGSAIYRRVK